MLHFGMANNLSRRRFLRAAPLAAISLPLAPKALFGSASPTDAAPASHETFQLISAENFSSALTALPADAGQHFLYQPHTIPLAIALFAEGNKAAGEFEYHDARDHIFQILDGAALFELGGTPQSPRNVKPGEWLAPSSTGATPVVVKKGDMLLIPRGTPHRHSTETGVRWLLISDTAIPKP